MPTPTKRDTAAEERHYPPLVYTVEAADDGRTLRDVLRLRLGLSRRLLVRLKADEDALRVDGRPAKTWERVAGGSRIELRMQQESSDDILPQPMELDIVFEDDHLLVLNKPPGLVVHPTTGHYAGTLANGVMHYWLRRGERRRFRPVHRLDEDTSGLVVVAKDPYAHQQLAVQMEQGAVVKSYRAYVYGKPAADTGVIDAPIGRDPADPRRRTVRDDGAPSVTRYALARAYRCGASALDVRLGTGRTHQIRVHLSARGCPIIGDALYGDPRASHPALAEALAPYARRQALHAARLAFRHPVTGAPMELEAALPDDLRELERALSRLDAEAADGDPERK
jgi:23S rRNA pseudouridine1911/1915/1917 synthase